MAGATGSPEFVADARGVRVCRPHRTGPVAGLRQRVDEEERCRRIDRVEGNQPLMPPGSLGEIARLLGAARQIPERVPAPSREARAFGIGPPRELVAPGHVEPVEKGPAVLLDRLVRTPGPERRLEDGVVGGHDRRVEADVGDAEHEIVDARRPAQAVERLRERAAPSLGLGIGPECRDDLVAADPGVAAGDEHGEHGERAPLSRRRAEWRAVGDERERAEGGEAEAGHGGTGQVGTPLGMARAARIWGDPGAKGSARGHGSSRNPLSQRGLIFV
jgi:hypothetical protein